METMNKETLLEVKNLKVYFPVLRGVTRKKVADVKAVDDVSFTIAKGETLGLVGESGCGKTTVGRAVSRLIQATSGEIFFEGENFLSLSKSQLKKERRKISLIFQDPYGSLDPRQSAGNTVGEPLNIHHMVNGKEEFVRRVEELFLQVGLDPAMYNRMPHEFSGGQRQRLGIARALACDPSLIICDEPISALDVSIQAQVINLLMDLQKERKDLSYLFIAHDISVVRHISDRIAVMYLGHIVEITDSAALYRNPLHPYTQALLSAVPIPDPFVEETRQRILLEGEVPSPLDPPSGCPFRTRCRQACAECAQRVPKLVDVGEGHCVACIRVNGEI